jgi:uncharacterized membrane protein YqgA involved in biofilm formation
MILYVLKWHKHFDVHITLLFIVIPVTNLGYCLLGHAETLEGALACNKLTYVGGCYALLLNMLLIFSLVIGCLLGQWLDIESKMETLGIKLKAAARIKNDNRFVEGFVTTSLIICVGAMAIVGAMQDGLSGDSSMLIAKSLLDFALVAILASAYGVGAVFSAIPIFLYQGAITLIAALFGAVIGQTLIDTLSFVGSALIFCVGVNLVREKTFQVANMLPALLIPVLYELAQSVF